MKKMEGGQIVARLMPSLERQNPRNSEGAFLTLKNGEIIFVYSRYRGNNFEDESFCDLGLIRSFDGGRTFGEEEVIITYEEEAGVNVMSVSLLEMQNGDIGLFYLVRTTYTMAQIFLRRSSDGGRTWSERTLCSPREGFFVVNNDRAVRLSDGRIIIPAAFHDAGWKNAPDSGERYFDSRSKAQFFLSDDDGHTWRQAYGECALPYSAYSRSGLQEPGVLELAPGILYGWARTDIGCQWEFVSIDNGERWTPCQPSRFTSPCSPMSMKRDREGTIYAIWNPIPQYNGRENPPGFFTGGRTPLVMAASHDNGRTFSDPVILEDDKGRGYCYCAVHFTEDAMLLAYCAGGKEERSTLAMTAIRRIPFSALKAAFPKK